MTDENQTSFKCIVDLIVYSPSYENLEELEHSNKVILNSTASVNGNIKASIVSIEEGANFDGICNMLKPNETKVKKINTLSS